MSAWYCCNCGDGTYNDGAFTCPKCGPGKSFDTLIEGSSYYGGTEWAEKIDMSSAAKSELACNVDSATTSPWYTFGHSAWTEPLMHVGLFSLASAAALDVGGEDGAWSSSPWSPLTNCHEPLNFGHSDVRDEIYCGGHTIVSTIAFTAAATTIHHLRREDRCQDVCLFASITCGVGIGLCLGNNLHDMMFSILPWAILTGLLCSILMHRLWNCTKCGNADEKCLASLGA